MTELIKDYPIGNSIDLTGQKINRLTVVEYLGAKRYGNRNVCRMYACVCDCGGTTVSPYENLRKGRVISCGCYQKEKAANRFLTHGNKRRGKETNQKEYGTWCNMKSRCYNPNYEFSEYYKDIKVCERWVDSFENFLEDMGKAPKGYTLDRIDNTKDYSPNNCRWASWHEQANNTRKSRFIEHNGERKTVAEWSREKGLVYSALLHRLDVGWDIERALNTPSKKIMDRYARRIINRGTL